SGTRDGGSRQPRGAAGSLLAALDVHPRIAMQILQHSKIGLSMEIYTEVPPAATRTALKRLGQWLGILDYCFTLLLHQAQRSQLHDRNRPLTWDRFSHLGLTSVDGCLAGSPSTG